MLGRKNLVSKAKQILGDDTYKLACNWYKNIVSDNWHYVIFTLRRSYILALIMEKCTGKKMSDCKITDFITSASIYGYGEEIAECFLRRQRFPRIMICDDTTISGRDLNNVLFNLEARVFEILKNKLEFSESDLEYELCRNQFLEAIKLHSIAVTARHIVIRTRYMWCFKYGDPIPPEEIHLMSHNISELILRADIANTAHEFSISVKEKTGNKILHNAIEVKYWNKSARVHVNFIKSNKGNEYIKAVTILRMVKVAGTKDRYRIIPLVLLPNLSEEETVLLREDLKNRIKKKKYRHIRNDFFDELDDDVLAKQISYDRINFVLSLAVLKDAIDKANYIPGKTIVDNEIEKLSRVYAYPGENTNSILNELYENPVVNNLKDFETLLNKVINSSKYVLSYTSGIQDLEEKEVKKFTETFLYNSAYKAERDVFQTRKSSKFVLKRNRSILLANEVLNFLCVDLSENDSKKTVAYIALMFDVGVGMLSPMLPKRDSIKGYCQYFKSGEQGLLVYPMLMYEYMRLIYHIWFYCISCLEIFDEQIDEYYKTGESGLTQNEVEKIKKYVDVMKSCGHIPGFWKGDYYLKSEEYNSNSDKGTIKDEKVYHKSIIRMLKYIKYLEDSGKIMTRHNFGDLE